MYEFVSGCFYLPTWAGPTVENKFYRTKKLARSDRKYFLKNQDGVFEQEGGKHWQIS